MALLDNRYMKATGIHGHTESLSKLPMCPNLPRHLQKGEKIKIKRSCGFFPSLIYHHHIYHHHLILKYLKKQSLESLSFIIHSYWELTGSVLPSYTMELQLATGW